MNESQSGTKRNDQYRLVWVVVFLATGFVAIGGLSWLRGSGKDLVPWRTNFDAARAEAAQSHKPVLLYFTTEWCPGCQELRRTTWSDRQVADTLGGAYVPVKIDAEQQPGLAMFYHVDGYPWLAVLDEQGRMERVWTRGWLGPDELLAWLKG